jgi:hypothetical protein
MPTLDQHQGTGTDIRAYYQMAQTLITPAVGTHRLTAIAVRIARGALTAIEVMVNCSVYTVDGDHKPDTLVANMGDKEAVYIPTSFNWHSFTGDTTKILDADTEYAIVLSITMRDGVNNYIRWDGGAPGYHATWSDVFNDGNWAGGYGGRRFTSTGADTAAPSKAINPTPADDEVDVDIALDVLMWETVGDEDTMAVYFGPAGAMEPWSGEITEFYTSISDLEAGQEYEWRVDTTNGFGTTTGDVWSFTVAGPSYLVEPVAPTFEATGEKIVANGLSWDSEDVDVVFDVLFREFGTTEFTVLAESITDLLFAFPYNLTYNQIYFWQINEYTVDPETGERTLVSSTDEQQFTTEALIKYPEPSRRNIPIEVGGSETMSVITGDNCLAGIRRIVAACNNTIYYEAIE